MKRENNKNFGLRLTDIGIGVGGIFLGGGAIEVIKNLRILTNQDRPLVIGTGVAAAVLLGSAMLIRRKINEQLSR